MSLIAIKCKRKSRTVLNTVCTVSCITYLAMLQDHLTSGRTMFYYTVNVITTFILYARKPRKSALFLQIRPIQCCLNACINGRILFINHNNVRLSTNNALTLTALVISPLTYSFVSCGELAEEIWCFQGRTPKLMSTVYLNFIFVCFLLACKNNLSNVGFTKKNVLLQNLYSIVRPREERSSALPLQRWGGKYWRKWDCCAQERNKSTGLNTWLVISSKSLCCISYRNILTPATQPKGSVVNVLLGSNVCAVNMH